MNYSYICPHCSHRWVSDSYNTNECKSCGYWQTICSYADGDIPFNQNEYQQVSDNINTDTKYALQCVDCGKQASFYFDQWITCSCGGMMQQEVEPQDYISKLKQYRKKKKLSQQQMAKKVGMTQGYYSKIEAGNKPIPSNLMKFINKKLS